MSGTRTQTAGPTIDEMGFNTRFGDGTVSEHGNMPALQPGGGAGSRTDAAVAQIVTAQRCAVKRDLPRILLDIDQAAAVAADDWYYRWETKNRDGTKGEVIGASIKCAMGIASIWGNCMVEAIPAQETMTHWTFLARFVDYEKGVTITRSYQQRKNQRAGGKMGDDRAQDMAFQIGQSKAMRNAVVGALGIYTDRAVEAAKASAFQWIVRNLDRARDAVLGRAQKAGVPVVVMERFVARSKDKWLAQDILLLGGKLQSILDGMDDADTAFGTGEEDEGVAGVATDTVKATMTDQPKADQQQQQTDTQAGGQTEQTQQQPTQQQPTQPGPQRPARAQRPAKPKAESQPQQTSAPVEDKPATTTDGPPAGQFPEEDDGFPGAAPTKQEAPAKEAPADYGNADELSFE